ncbi:MAG: S26 family signal peptidase [Chloroflexota bacterium]|nr:S26 family signal peptidase [Chloroflexota bacterium]
MYVRARLLAITLLVSISCLIILFFLVPWLMDCEWAVISTNDMRPSINSGDLVLMEAVDLSDIEVNDIVLFKNPLQSDKSGLLRVVEKRGNKIVGFLSHDNLGEEQRSYTISSSEIQGKVRSIIPKLGHVLDAIGGIVHSRLGLALIVAIPAGLILHYEMTKIISIIRGED